MPIVNAVAPARMTGAERRAEIASLLALALIRGRTSKTAGTERDETDLGYSPPQRVHNPASRVRNRDSAPIHLKGV